MSDTDDQRNDPGLRTEIYPGNSETMAPLQLKPVTSVIPGSVRQKVHTDRGRLPISTTDGLLYLPFESLLHLQADGSYTHIYTDDKVHHLTCMGIGSLERVLPTDMFHRCHHAHVINLLKVARLFRTGGHRVQLITGDMIEVSRRKWRTLVSALDGLH